MIKNYFKISLRNIRKYKLYSVLNISGLAIGMCAFFLILSWVHFERSYEKHIPGSENMYRVVLEQYLNGDLSIESAENYPAVGPALLAEVPEVQSYARLYNMGYKNNVVITWANPDGEHVSFKQRRFLYADSSFLPMMDYEFVAGDPKTALAEPFSIVVSEEIANMYFGTEEPIGKMLRLNDDDFNNELCKVTGVFKNVPQNTHIKFDVLISYKTLLSRGEWAPGRYNESWRRKDMYTYVKLSESTNIDAVEKKLAALIQKFSPVTEIDTRDDKMYLQPIRDIHLTSNLAEEVEANGDIRNVDFMEIIAFIICILAWVNYINLSTSKSIERAMEVGLRKVMGAGKQGLMMQFLVETGIINLISLLIAAGLMLLVLPLFNDLSAVNFTASLLIEPWFLTMVLIIWVGGTLIAGIYPGYVISSFKPSSALKGASSGKGIGAIIRKVLVVLQFMIAATLITGTLVVGDQLKFMMSGDIGMNIDQILVAERPAVAENREVLSNNIEVFRNIITDHPAVLNMSSTITIPGKKREYKSGVKKYGDLDENAVTLRLNSMDYDFIDVFEMKVLAGRAFSRDYVNDPDTAAVLSESAVFQLGYKKVEDIIGETITLPQWQTSRIVVGVVNDYHQESLKKEKDPMIFMFFREGEFYSMRVKGNDIPAAVDHLRSSWEKAFPGNPLEYYFLDDYFNAQYEKDVKFGSLFNYFSVLSIFIGCLGLFGLSAFSIRKRMKEIGIRKVLGSSDSGLFYVLGKSFLTIIAISIGISIPITFFVLNNWLSSFAYRVDFSVLPYLLSAGLLCIIAFLTIGYNLLRAANVNPTNVLRNE